MTVWLHKLVFIIGLLLVWFILGWLVPKVHAAEAIPRNALQYQAELTREARFVYGLVAPVATFAAQIHQESSWNPEARSAYANGLAQFTPQTADWISGVYKQLGPSAPSSPGWAMRALLLYDKKLNDAIKLYDTTCDRWLFSLSDYNGGAGRRIRRQSLSPKPGSYNVTGSINPGISENNQRENQSYGPKILFTLQPLYKPWGAGVNCK